MLYSTANSGTPITIPAKPITPPNSRMANMTQKLDSPVALPRIFGPRIRPSNCCNTNTMTTKITALSGLIKSRMIVLGMAPMNGPKYGIMFVIPTITLISTA